MGWSQAERISRGIGEITQIEQLLEMVSLGEHFVEIATLFRESMFVNGILMLKYGIMSVIVK